MHRVTRPLLLEKIEARRPEIERAILNRVYAVADESPAQEPRYEDGLASAVTAAVGYGLLVLEREISPGELIPTELFSRARIAARSGTSLDTVLRRYFAGYALLGDFIVEEGEEGGAIPAHELRLVMRGQAVLFDRLLAAIAEEYTRTLEGYARSTDDRRAERVRMLLAGELVDATQLGYDLDSWHLGAVAAGPGARQAILGLAATLGRRPLVVRAPAGTVWAWLGGRKTLDAQEALDIVEGSWPVDVALAVGEPGEGLGGWRRTHQQAQAALPIALRSTPNWLRYADVALLATAINDSLLASSLRDLFLTPLGGNRDDGATLRRTGAAYFAAGRNASSAAAALGVSRKTVSLRLRSIEERIGQPIEGCAAELDTALRLCQLMPLPDSDR